MQGGDHVMSLRLPRAMIEALREIARAEQRSVAAQIRVMITEGLMRRHRPDEAEESGG